MNPGGGRASQERSSVRQDTPRVSRPDGGEPAVEARNLTRRFGDLTAVEGLEVAVGRGEVFGLLGPNGAGKTTTIRLLAGIMRPTAGEVRILGIDVARDPVRAKSATGYVAQAAGLYGDLTVQEHLDFYGALYARRDPARAGALIDRYGFAPLRHRLARELSGGYRTRLALLVALAHRPEILLLDEPTAGVDPVTRKELWDLFYALKGEGTTLVVSTHYMEEAERCDRLAFLVRGRLAALGTPAHIRAVLSDRDVFTIETPYAPAIHAALAALPGFETSNQFGAVLRAVYRKDAVTAATIAERLAPLGVPPEAVRAGGASLEDVFVALTTRAAPPLLRAEGAPGSMVMQVTQKAAEVRGPLPPRGEG